jgi:hypothetical protein
VAVNLGHRVRDVRINRLAVAFVCAVAALVPAVPAAASGASFASAAYRAADRVVLERTGGFAGRHDTFLVDRSTVDGGATLRLAGSPQFRRLRASYQPANPCCDRFAYQVTAYYRAGRSKTVSTVEGTRAPRVLWDVIRSAEQVGRQTADASAG